MVSQKQTNQLLIVAFIAFTLLFMSIIPGKLKPAATALPAEAAPETAAIEGAPEAVLLEDMPVDETGVTVGYTLRAELGRVPALAYVGVGGTIDGIVNPRLTANVGDRIVITLVNGDPIEHDLVVDEFGGHRVRVSSEGEQSTFEFVAGRAGTFSYYSSLAGHQQIGMEGVVEIIDPTLIVEVVPEDSSSTSDGTSTTVAAVDLGYDPELVARGETQFASCVACHGPDARGLPNLGKDLVTSEFVSAQTDEALVQFIMTGRPIWDPLNTSGIDMPGKGGNPAMTSDDILAIVAYIRTLHAQNSGATPAEPVSNSALAYDPELVALGERSYSLCSACHGPDARGLPNLGKDLVTSEFVAGLTDEALLAFVKTGRPIWDPLNTTGLDMPGKGGNPALKDEEILAIIAYVRTLSAGGG